ncbi:MAG: hypothetical protein R3F11_20165 [Verrucomicrobiales bacterium]
MPRLIGTGDVTQWAGAAIDRHRSGSRGSRRSRCGAAAASSGTE